MKDKIVFWLFVTWVVVSNCLGLWMLMGGDLSDFTKGCYDAKGCK